ncbi:MAG: serine beta-lactamase-like protein LACTB [Phenylobacterium sp.]|jgi:serine beta-lactamase-like protein LACTB
MKTILTNAILLNTKQDKKSRSITSLLLPTLTGLLLSGFSHLAIAAPSPQPALSTQQISAINHQLTSIFEEQQMVGLQGAVFDNNRIVSSINSGYADLEHKVAVTADTRFEIASITKAFTGLGLLLLEQAGKIDQDQPIQKYVPTFPVKAKGTITPRLLSGNLAGIRHYKEEERTPRFYTTHYDDVNDALQLFKDDPLVVKPAEKFKYSSYGYNLLAAAIQGASGERFQDYIQRTMLQPLGLKNTGFIDIRLPMENRSRSYSYVEPRTREVLDHLQVVPNLEHSYNMGGGNMYSSASDLVTFGSQFLQPGFISADVLKQIYQPHFDSQGRATYVSDGWIVTEINKSPRSLVMAGSYPGVISQLMVYPDQGVVVAFASNTWGKSGGASFGPKGSVTQLINKLNQIIAPK